MAASASHPLLGVFIFSCIFPLLEEYADVHAVNQVLDVPCLSRDVVPSGVTLLQARLFAVVDKPHFPDVDFCGC